LERKDLFREDLTSWRDNLTLGIYLLEHQGGSLEDALVCLGLTSPNDHDFFVQRYHSARERGTLSFVSNKPGWFFIGARPGAEKFVHQAIGYLSRTGQSIILQNDYVGVLERSPDLTPKRGTIDPHKRIVSEDVLSTIRTALTGDDLRLGNQVVSSVWKDTFCREILEHFKVKSDDPRLLSFVELLLRSQDLVAFSAKDTEEDLLKKRFKCVFHAFETLNKRVTDMSRECVLDDAYDQLVEIDLVSQAERRR